MGYEAYCRRGPYKNDREHVKIKTPNLVGHGSSEDFKRESIALRNVKEANDESVPAGGFGIEKGTLTIPTDWRGLTTLLLGFIGLISITVYISRFLSSSKTMEEEQDHDNHINIINNLTPTDVKTGEETIETKSSEITGLNRVDIIGQSDPVYSTPKPAIMKPGLPNIIYPQNFPQIQYLQYYNPMRITANGSSFQGEILN